MNSGIPATGRYCYFDLLRKAPPQGKAFLRRTGMVFVPIAARRRLFLRSAKMRTKYDLAWISACHRTGRTERFLGEMLQSRASHLMRSIPGGGDCQTLVRMGWEQCRPAGQEPLDGRSSTPQALRCQPPLSRGLRGAYFRRAGVTMGSFVALLLRMTRKLRGLRMTGRLGGVPVTGLGNIFGGADNRGVPSVRTGKKQPTGAVLF